MASYISELVKDINRTVFIKYNSQESFADFIEMLGQYISGPTDYEDEPSVIYVTDLTAIINDNNSFTFLGSKQVNIGEDFYSGNSFTLSEETRQQLDQFGNSLQPGSEINIYFQAQVTGNQTVIGADYENIQIKQFSIQMDPDVFYSQQDPLLIEKPSTTINPQFNKIELIELVLDDVIVVKDITDLATINPQTFNYEYVKNNYDGAARVFAGEVIYGSDYPSSEDTEVSFTISNGFSAWIEAKDPVYEIDYGEMLDAIELKTNIQGDSILRGATYHAEIWFKTAPNKKLNFKVYCRGIDVTQSCSDYSSLGDNEKITIDIPFVNGDIYIQSELVRSTYVRWYDHNQKQTTFTYFSIKDGWSYEENFSEELDNATIIIRTTKTNFEPMDMIELNNFGERTMLIISVAENKCNFIPQEDGEELYDYIITLGSLTKALERIPCPNFSYTKPFAKPRKKIIDVINFILDDYSPKIIVNGERVNTYHFVDLHGFCSSTDCPDMVFEKPTLREAIDQILSVVNCIATVTIINNYLVIQPMWLNETYGEVSEQQLKHFKYPQENQSIEDYASETENDYHNITPDLKNDRYTLVTEYLHFVNEENTQITTNNMCLQTNYPIYDIKDFKMIVFNQDNKAKIKNFAIGLNEVQFPYVGIVESQEYQLIQYIQRRYLVRYTRGDNKIVGWGDKYPTTLLGLTEHEVFWYLTLDISDNFWKTFAATTFKMQYYTLTENVRAKSGKLLPEAHNSVLINGQTAGYVDMDLQGTQFQDKVNRLGNRCKILQGRFSKNESNLIPDVGMSIKNLVVINRQLTFYNNFVAVKLTLTENYININYFTGINARRRSWNLVNINETINKQLLQKWFCEFDFVRGNRVDPITSWQYQNKFINQALLSCFNESLQQIPCYAFARSINDSYKDGDKRAWLQLELNKYISGRSIIFHFKFYDNYSAGKFLREADVAEEDSYAKVASSFQEYANYTNNDGELSDNRYQIVIMDNNYTDNTGVIVPKDDGNAYTDQQIYDFLDFARNKPLSWLDYMDQTMVQPCVVYITDIENRKDSKECIEFNIQFEYCSATSDIIVTPLLAQRCKMLSIDQLPNINYHLDKRNYYLNDKYYYSETGRDITEGDIDINVAREGKSSNNECTIAFYNEVIESDDKSLILTQTTPTGEEIIMVINNIHEHTREASGGMKYIDFYMNMYLNNRDHKNYTSNDMKNWTI